MADGSAETGGLGARAEGGPAANPLPGPVAWLTGDYVRASHTFIQREAAALRALGLDLRPFSIRPVAADQITGPEWREEAGRVAAVLPVALRPLPALAAHAAALGRSPGLWARMLGRAWATAAPGWRGRAYGLIWFHEAVVLARALRRIGAVHLHNHFAMASCVVARMAAPLAGVSWSFTLHGPDDLSEAGRYRLDESIRGADFVVCISAFARSQAMLRAEPEDWDKLHVVHCGVEPGRYAGEAPGDPDRLLFVGRLAAVKGVRVLLAALALARRERPGLHLRLVGDGPERGALEAEAVRLGLAGAVAFLGARGQAEVAAELAACGALVLPSFAEGVPVVLMEAMAAARPVVATRIAGVAELVEDGVSGLLVPPGEEEALARAMLAATADPARAAAMGAAGRARVRSEFDARAEAGRLARLVLWAREGGARPARRPEPWGA
jgi:glycosyltransferase involved in cell wall biosynthesis